MDGRTLTQIVDKILVERGISRSDFCKAIGISSASYSGWKNGSQPRDDKIIAIENYLEVDLSHYEKNLNKNIQTDAEEILDWIMSDYSHRALFESARDLTRSEALTAASFIEKLKAGEVNGYAP